MRDGGSDSGAGNWGQRGDFRVCGCGADQAAALSESDTAGGCDGEPSAVSEGQSLLRRLCGLETDEHGFQLIGGLHREPLWAGHADGDRACAWGTCERGVLSDAWDRPGAGPRLSRRRRCARCGSGCLVELRNLAAAIRRQSRYSGPRGEAERCFLYDHWSFAKGVSVCLARQCGVLGGPAAYKRVREAAQLPRSLRSGAG